MFREVEVEMPVRRCAMHEKSDGRGSGGDMLL